MRIADAVIQWICSRAINNSDPTNETLMEECNRRLPRTNGWNVSSGATSNTNGIRDWTTSKERRGESARGTKREAEG